MKSVPMSIYWLYYLAVHALTFASLYYIKFVTADQLLVTMFCYFLMSCIGGTIIFHRYLSHKSFEPPSWFYKLGMLCAIYGFYGKPLAWVAIHRKHHNRTDQPEDPHSPAYQSWLKVQFLSYLQVAEPKYVRDLVSDPVIKFAQKNYFKVHLVIIPILALIDWKSLIYAYLWPMILTWHFSNALNYFCHKFGYRNFATKDLSTNFFPFAIFLHGEGWHNNHHANPKSYSFSHKWWEFDLAALIISLVRKRSSPALHEEIASSVLTANSDA